ncbi:Peptidase propeptide and YPEB domain-containing protein [Thalassovita litoralis]|jgi:hypothetical protein|uniref:Peptidase propeptide and YPEB domain-containing protein n=1 Tax=Thalassovita litoralis TaxID=1010611 RepID=A0A521BWU2_9RHOB|nr:PepSY domain-containing protein [Thalassovita litoralis]SMO51061.1 Peptidase propeptide and YPEB domain-containing protein [Thalassovita litoralis]
MIRKLTSAALAGVLVAGLASPVLASGKVSEDMQTKIRAHLTEQGYDVRKIKREDGLYEAYVMKDGQKLEVYLDEQLTVVRTKSDD